MSDPKAEQLATVGADLAAAETARAEMHLKHQEFMLACQLGDWSRAEQAQTAAQAYFEAHLDAFTRAWKRTNGAA